MGANLETILAKVEELQQQVIDLPSLLTISPSQVVISQLADLSGALGLVQAGEFRSGNTKAIGDSFSGMRMKWPPMHYPSSSTESSDRYNFVGVDQDTMMFGIRASDGVAIAGGGVVQLDSTGITITGGEADVHRIKWVDPDSGSLTAWMAGHYSTLLDYNYFNIKVGTIGAGEGHSRFVVETRCADSAANLVQNYLTFQSWNDTMESRTVFNIEMEMPASDDFIVPLSVSNRSGNVSIGEPGTKFAGGIGCLYITDATQHPDLVNPTTGSTDMVVGGGLIYVAGGDLYWMNSDGDEVCLTT